MIHFREDVDYLCFPAETADRALPRAAPMILFLHGIGERGRGGVELDRVAAWGLPKFLRQRTPLLDRAFPFLVVAPQCPPENTWCDKQILDALDRLVEDLVDTGRADPDRLCLTGFSMGGIGAFCLALRHPDRFAAVATVCGRCSTPEALPALAGRPLWVAYAEDDEIAELTAGSKQVIDTFAGSPNLTTRIYRPGWHEDLGPHARTCDQAYMEPDLYHWFQDHTRKP